MLGGRTKVCNIAKDSFTAVCKKNFKIFVSPPAPTCPAARPYPVASSLNDPPMPPAYSTKPRCRDAISIQHERGEWRPITLAFFVWAMVDNGFSGRVDIRNVWAMVGNGFSGRVQHALVGNGGQWFFRSRLSAAGQRKSMTNGLWATVDNDFARFFLYTLLLYIYTVFFVKFKPSTIIIHHYPQAPLI